MKSQRVNTLFKGPQCQKYFKIHDWQVNTIWVVNFHNLTQISLEQSFSAWALLSFGAK